MTQRSRNVRRKSDPALPFRPTQEKLVVAAELPWGLPKIVPVTVLDYGLPTGPFAGQSVLLDLFGLFERKLQSVAEEEPIEKLLNKSLQRGGDPYFDNLCRTLHGISELCLPSVINALIKWDQHMERKINDDLATATDTRVLVKKLLAVNYLFCIVLIEILPQVEFHLSACEQQVKYLLDSSFHQVQYKDPATLGVNNTNSLVVSETYAEVIGVLSETHFTQIHRQFMNILSEMKKDNSPGITHNIISLLMAMKFVKIKTNQVEDFELGLKFLDDLGSFLLEVKDKDIKHAVAGLLVEILLPIAAQIKRETNIPALITFVCKLFGPTNELASKKQHKLAAYPLLTCLLCVSQRQFFLSNWVPFLNNTLANLKNRDSRISRVALESLYRLLWVYMIRNNYDGNSATRTRLESICGSLFPKGNRGIVPRDAPLNIFVKIIHFIAQQKLDFAFKDVIFDLLACNRTQRSLYPERMNIGIRALMVIADGLQQKDEPPSMPKSMGPSASGTMQRLRKKTYITRPLTVDIAKAIGLDQYYIPCRKAFDTILRILDTQVGRPLMLTAIQKGKEPDELLGGDVKPKLDLFRTCVAAIPRLLPEPMTYTDLIDILTRITVHIDEELRTMSGNTLQNIMGEFPEWREHVVIAEIALLQNQLTDFYPAVLDEALRLLHQMIVTWKSAAIQEKKKEQQKDSGLVETSQPVFPSYFSSYASALHAVEGLALVMLCQIRPQPKKIAISLLKEVKQIISILSLDNADTPAITVLDEATPYVVRKYIEHVSLYERMSWNLDFTSACEKIAAIDTDNCLVNSDKGNEYLQWDPWACALSGYAERKHLVSRCPTAVATAWPALFHRLIAVNTYVDPSNPQNENRASLLRGSKSKASSVCGEALSQEGCLSLWQKYLVLCCAFAPSPNNHSSFVFRSFSPTSSMETDVLKSVPSSLRVSSRTPSTTSTTSLSQLFTKVAAMLRWENMTDIRDSVVLGVGSMSAVAFEGFLEDLNQRGILRDAMEKKLETNVRRRKRKDLLRLQLIRIIEVAVFRGLLECTMLDANGTLNSLILDFVDSMRANLENDLDRDIAVVTMMRLHFSKLVAVLIDGVGTNNRTNLIPDEKKQSLFYLFTGWCSRTIAADKKILENEVGSYVEQKATLAMTRLLMCGRIFEMQKSIGEDGYLYGWLEKLVSSANATMQEEVEEMLALMLELNESSQLLDWLMSQSYSQPNVVAAKCFRALVRVFSRRDFPCEFISLFVLCQAMLGDASVIDAAVHMIEILKRQFLDNSSSAVVPPQLASIANIGSTPTSAQLKSQIMSRPHNHCFPIDQQSVCRNLANSYPHLTITIFSEVSYRLEGARIQNRTYLLSLLLPWIENIELVDPAVGEDCWEGPRGWGSEEATHLLLNNLMYLTVYLAPDHENEIAELWRALAFSFPANLPVILNYLYIVTVLSCDTFLPYAKRISVTLAGVVGNRIAALLLEQLTMSFDSSRLILERFDRAPYYRWKDDVETKKDSVVEVSLPVRQSPWADRFREASEDTSKEGVRLLPMPAYSGYYSKLCKYLPPTTQPVQFFTRSQVSLLLICDIIRTSSDVDWNEATPRIFHIAVLSLDSLRPALCRHARQIIINISLLHADKDTLAHVSAMLLKHQMCRSTSDDNKFKTPPTPFCDPEVPRGISPTFARVANEEYRNLLLNSNTLFSSQNDLIMALVFCLSENMGSPLWSNEDATPRCWKVPSAAQLTCLVRHLAELMLPIIPLLPVVWTQLAMRMALTTTQRHAAGRCFQIVSALCQPPGTWIPSLISRLVETAGETHDETQAYVTDLLLCLISSAPHLNPLLDPPLVSSVSPTHTRSTSYTPALLRQSLLNQRLHQERKDARLSLLLSENDSSLGVALMRSKSADQLKTEPEGDEEAIARMQICAIAVALLESGVDNEFLLSLNLLEKVLDTSGAHKTRCLQKLEKTIHQLDWKGFNGIVGLLSRGSVVPSAYEPSIQALVRVVDVLDEPVVGGRDSLGIVVCHVLPYLLFNFDSPNHLCVLVCTVLKQYCSESLKKLEITQADYPLNNLATMLSHYSTKSFSKDRYQWTKCVLQYLCEAIDVSTVQQMIVLLAEMLEKGTASMHVYVLHMLYLLLLRQDAINSNHVINAQVVRSISRHVQGTNWREAARVYKVIVEQWQSAEKDNITIGDILSGLEFDKLQISPATRPSSPSSRKNVSTVDSSASITIVRKQAPTHTRVRDRLLGLLSASGLRVDLPSAVSVVFSQSDLVSTTSSNERICTSSQEIASTTSLPDPSASITDSFPRVFKEFDFLEAEHDSVSETADSCFGWLSTMRPRSIGDEPPHDDDVDLDEDEDSETAQANSEGVGASTSRLSQTSISSDRTPCASEVDEDEDEGDDGFGDISSPASALQAHDSVSPPSAISRNTLEKRQGDNLNGVDEESIDGSSFCCRSRASVCELYSQKTPLTLSVYIQCPHHLDGKVDNIWISTVAELQDDSEGELTAYATLLFTQLFRSCCGRVTSLLRDAMHILSSRSLTRTLAQAQGVLTEVADCPFLFVTAQYLRCSGVLSRLKLSLFELREHWETFNERKEQSIRLLNSVKSAHKLNALVGSTSSFTVNSEMELGKLLSKLFFQLMLMSDSLNDMVILVSESHGSQAYTLSPAVLDHQRELLICVADLPQRDLQSSVLSEHSGDSLVLLMTNKRYAQALHTLRQLRTAFGQEFGCCEASDIDVLLLLFCRSHLLKAWALVGAVPDVLRRQSQCLRDANADMASAVRRLASDSAPSHRTTASSLTDSFQKISYLPD